MSHYIQTIFTLIAVLIVSGAQAATTYQYTGNNFNTFIDDDPPVGSYTTAMSLTGSFTVAAPLGPMGLTDISASILSYSFNDGRTTLTESNSTILSADVAVNGTAQITSWNFDINTTFPSPVSVGDQRFLIATVNLPPGVIADIGRIEECVTIGSRGCLFGLDQGTITGQPGAWSVVPIPAAVWLFGSGLLGLIGLAKRKRAY